MSLERRRLSTRVVLLASAVLWVGACDALIGIEDLQVKHIDGISCSTPADCPATGNPCFVRACTSAGSCELRDVEPGYVVPGTTPGDCLRQVCNGGNAADEVDPTDVPSDGNPCTVETCSAEGQPQTGFAEPGTACTDGMTVCDGGGNCVECVGPEQCNSNQQCIDHQCIGAGCADGTTNGEETDKDCGGPDCQPCGTGKHCLVAEDCKSGVCEGSGSNKTCQAPSCDDNVLNGNETDKDCGGSCPNACQLNQMCKDDADCESLFCDCQEDPCVCHTPQCDDGIQNGTEVDVDCGADCANDPGHTCVDGMPCDDETWCQSGVCQEGHCQAPTCNDGVSNGLETGVDCGGPDCDPCSG